MASPALDDTTTAVGALTPNQLKVLRGLAGGTVGGVLAAATGHPLDTVKARVQNGLFPNISSCVRSTWNKEGLSGFYRGVTPPLLLGGVYNSIMFGLNQFMTNLVTPADWDESTLLPAWRTVLAAEMTAPPFALVFTPMEKVKVMLQVQGMGGVATSVTGPISCIKYIWQRYGPMGFLSGYVPTLMTRVIGLPFYFVGYKTVKEYLITQTSCGETKVGREIATPMLGGVAAGLAFWTSNYPCDFIKTQMQASKTKVTVREIVSRTYRNSGVKGFYRGFIVCLVRSCPAQACVFLGVEAATRFMVSHGW